MKDNNRIVYAYLLLTFAIWGGVYVATRFAIGSFPSPVVACLRNALACVTLVVMMRGEKFPKIRKGDIKYFALVSVMGYYFTLSFTTIGAALAGASTASLVNALTPVAVTVIASLILKEKIDAVRVLCLALAIVGTCCVLRGGGETGSVLGIFLVLLSLVTQGINSVMVRILSTRYTAKQITTIGMLGSMVLHLPTAAVSLASAESVSLTLPAVLALLYMGVVGTGLAQLFWSKSLAIKEASFCSMFYPLQPVFSALYGFFLLDENLGVMFFVGLAIIAASVILSCVHSAKQEKSAQRG